MIRIGKSNSIKCYLNLEIIIRRQAQTDVRHERYRTPQLYRRPHPQIARGQRLDTANAGQQIGEENLYYQCLRDKRQVTVCDCLIEMADLLAFPSTP